MGMAEIHLRNENHRAHRAGWLRAAVLGVNDGLVSTASLMIGVVSAQKNDFVVTVGFADLFKNRWCIITPTNKKILATLKN